MAINGRLKNANLYTAAGLYALLTSVLLRNAWSWSLAAVHVRTRPDRHPYRAVTCRRLQTDMGGSSAPRSTEDGVASIVAAAEGPREGKLSGKFWRDGRQISMEDGKPV